MRICLTTVIVSALLVVTAAAQEASESRSLVLEKFGVMFVGGQSVEMPAGGRFGGGGKQTQIAGRAPVHYLIPPPQRRAGKRPVIMIPGMGLTSYLYLGTPDGREGWAQTFAKAGHPVYVFDEPNNAISGFEVGRFTASEQPPRIMLWSNEMTWRRWGIGPEPGVPAENTRFPVEHIDQLHASLTPVMGGGGPRGGGGFRGRGGRFGRFRRGSSSTESSGDDASNAPPGDNEESSNDTPRRGRRGRGASSDSNPKVQALVELLKKVGPANLVLHSASGPTGFDAARREPKLVKAIVAVEVTGSPTQEADIRDHFAQIQLIGVYGDNFNLRPMAGRLEATREMAKAIRDGGGQAEVIWLPEQGVKGNSHLLMQDNNNDEIARMIIKRLEK